MKNLLSKTGGLLVGGLCVAGTLPLSAASLYDNSGSLLAPVEPGTYEIGDQIVLTGGDLFTLSGFSFQYWGTSANNTSFTGLDANGVQVQVSFYLNNGAADPVSGEATPGTRLWQSSWFGINPDADGALLQYDAVNDGFSGVTLPSSFTWSVKFQGMSTTDHVGVDSFSRALGAAGMDYPDYWQNNNGNWQLVQANSGTPVSFGAKFEGTAVPEPSSMALLGLGGLGLAALAKRSRRQE